MRKVKMPLVHEKKWIIGIDEVGRGPLAGPVTVAAVVAPRYLASDSSRLALENIRDSKKLTSLQREKWVAVIKDNFVTVVSSVSPKKIDSTGIVSATNMAVTQCLRKLNTKYQILTMKYQILLDGGLHAPLQYKNQQTIIKGDEKEPLIAAASIVAKVHRDRYMTWLHEKYPRYGFDRHKGYGTVMHRGAIKKYGLSPMHRKSFCSNICVCNRENK